MSSIVLFNALVLLAVYVRYTKKPPADEDFDKLLVEQAKIKSEAEQASTENAELKVRLADMQNEVQKMEDNLRGSLEEIDRLKQAARQPAPS